ncbi:MAG: TOBE domain-containing protein [Rhodocyclaceae bacterium]
MDTPKQPFISAELSLNIDGESLGGARRIALLAQIGQLGSISHAAKAVGLSYKGAWDAIEQMNNLAGEPLLERMAGGKGGGHTHLTARGEQLVRNFTLIQQEHARFLARLNERAGLSSDYALVEGLAMKTSARNQFAGTIAAIRDGAVNDEVELDAIGGLRIVAQVTHESREALGLAVGGRAFAMVSANVVILMTLDDGARVSARNQLHGEVSRITPGAVNSEVVLALPGGGTIAAMVTNPSIEALGLALGTPACALFKASAVILGVGD